MKVLAKPISSPSRNDKFPPPLLKFLRSNGGSRSRGGRFRSTSSPIFIRKKVETTTETQEPSSPKVTCMGQVRVRRSKKKTVAKKNSRCRWIQKALFFCRFEKKSKLRTFSRRWVFPFQMGYPKKPEIIEESTNREAKLEEKEEEEEKGEIFGASTPPKNALLLIRCRSEPYRASSLANRFWGSPYEKNKAEEQQEENPSLEKEPICTEESRTNPEIEEKLGFCEGIKSSSNETNTQTSSSSSKNEAEALKIRPLILTRCKSEPARRTEKFDSETCFWKKRLEFVDISTTRF